MDRKRKKEKAKVAKKVDNTGASLGGGMAGIQMQLVQNTLRTCP